MQERGTERGERGECYILEDILKHSRKCSRTFWEMFTNIPGNVAKHSRECPQSHSLIYLVDEFLILFLVKLKGIRTLGKSKVYSYFLVLIKAKSEGSKSWALELPFSLKRKRLGVI